MTTPNAESVRLPRDAEARRTLAVFAGLTAVERAAIEQWCALEQREYESRLRRALEQVADVPMAKAVDGSEPE